MIRPAHISLILWCLIMLFLAEGAMAQAPNQRGWKPFAFSLTKRMLTASCDASFHHGEYGRAGQTFEEYVQKRSLSANQDNGIQRATYVARWNEQTLVSRASLLQIAGDSTTGAVRYWAHLISARRTQGVPEPALPLTRQLRYLDDNRLQILCEQNQSDYWFGFRAKTRRRDSDQHSIDLQIPQAVLSIMLVAVPTHSVVTSNLPCAAVTDVSKYLPEGWPPSACPRWALTSRGLRFGCRGKRLVR